MTIRRTAACTMFTLVIMLVSPANRLKLHTPYPAIANLVRKAEFAMPPAEVDQVYQPAGEFPVSPQNNSQLGPELHITQSDRELCRFLPHELRYSSITQTMSQCCGRSSVSASLLEPRTEPGEIRSPGQKLYPGL